METSMSAGASNPRKRRIYTLNQLPPEITAVAFAKSSRSPEPFDRIAAELTEEASSRFHEKWVVGYGHSSVAEHAVLSIAIENVSILATKVIEDNRLASYTEKSTRYQVFDRTKYYIPEKIASSGYAELYTGTCNFLFDSYSMLMERMISFMEQKHPRKDEPQGLYRTMIKNKALDSIRYVLPVSTLTNLGMTVNARSLEHAAVKLMSSPLDELKEIGMEMKEAGLKVTPTLVKYVEPNDYIIKSSAAVSGLAAEMGLRSEIRHKDKERHDTGAQENQVSLVEYDSDAEEKVISAILYRSSGLPYPEIRKKVDAMGQEARKKVFGLALGSMGKHDWPIRELEHCYFTFDIVMDYGSFRDIQRHRMATQTNQAFGAMLGYSVPSEVEEAGLGRQYRECMERAEKAYLGIARDFPEEAPYIVPMGFRKRMLFKCNLRELYHFIRLRSSRQGHASYRRIAQKMFLIIKEKFPLLASHIRADMSQ